MGSFPVTVPENFNPLLSLLHILHQTESHKLRFPGKDLLLLFSSLNLVKVAASHSSNQVGCTSVETPELPRGNHSVRGSIERPTLKHVAVRKPVFKGGWEPGLISSSLAKFLQKSTESEQSKASGRFGTNPSPGDLTLYQKMSDQGSLWGHQ